MTKVAAAGAIQTLTHYVIESFDFHSDYLDRVIKIDVYLPKSAHHAVAGLSLLLVNDGQDLPRMPFGPIVDDLLYKGKIKPLIIVGMHCNADRRLEYGTADVLDHMNRGSRARYHRKFVLQELIPLLRKKILPFQFSDVSFAGFSLGGLSALDIAWKHPEIFTYVGVFSGSLWWRSRDLNDGYVESTDRIMHQLIAQGKYAPGMKFFFETGILDETMDRNGNGIIDSIDDTLDLIAALEAKGYKQDEDIRYLELPDGRHDVPTWARAFPDFLQWAWGTAK